MNVIKHFLDSFQSEVTIDVKFYLHYNKLLAEHTGVTKEVPLASKFLEYLAENNLITLESVTDENGNTKTLTARKVINGNKAS